MKAKSFKVLMDYVGNEETDPEKAFEKLQALGQMRFDFDYEAAQKQMPEGAHIPNLPTLLRLRPCLRHPHPPCC